MRAVIQRVDYARLSIGGREFSTIGKGLLVLLGITHEDTAEDADWLARKVTQLRIFPDGKGVMNIPMTGAGAGLMVVSQFTLHALTSKGNRPAYVRAAPPELAVPLYEEFIRLAARYGNCEVETGEFGAMMNIELANNGPVTIIIDTKNKE